MTAAPLAGKRGLVTGGSRGIGAEIVRRLAGDGAAVVTTQLKTPSDFAFEATQDVSWTCTRACNSQENPLRQRLDCRHFHWDGASFTAVGSQIAFHLRGLFVGRLDMPDV